ncbi:FAD-dependent oxidoreductase [Streptomyces buecherae]|uniref:FAD-dependent oxidoreductase n=1 Tax=Streptomyces buecherae TaxID=2763006 RepID=A0A7H8N205_9ACTN|nr:FAD-dependent oxidoreductase [Streptomyces buecherae]MBC3991298.1 FAD-dependent oxidoreductase [Streptomyces buecherae]QKW48343.1 FAD-dependent oxidoreductase [Streptomyces buecherae]
MARRKRTAVVGGGMAGCAAAKELLKNGREVVIYETTAGLGGRARSWHRPEIEPDVGVNLWFTSFYKIMFERIREYGLEDQLTEMSNNVIVVDNGKPAELLSDSMKSLFTFPHVKLGDRIGFLTATLKETLKRKELDLFDPLKLAKYDDGTNAAEYARKSMSQRGFDNLLRPEIESFWLWRCEDISAAHVRAMQAQIAGAKFYVFKGGMEIIAEKNAEGAEIRLENEVTDLQVSDGEVRVTARDADGTLSEEVFDDVVMATPAPVAAKLTAALPRQIVGEDTRDFLATQKYEPALSVSYLVDFSSMPSEAHIVAAGAEDPPVKTIITFPRQVRDANGRPVDKHLAFVYPGRAATRRLLKLSTEEQFAETTRLVTSLWPDFPADAEPFEIAERPWAMPVPEPGRYRKSARVIRLQHAPVVFAGDYFTSPISEAAMLSGIRAADKLLTVG